MHKKITILFIFLLLIFPCYSSSETISLSFVELEISDILQGVASHFSRDFICSRNVNGSASILINDVGEEKAMKEIAGQNGFACERLENTWIIAKPPAISTFKTSLDSIDSLPDSPIVSIDFRDSSIRDILTQLGRIGNLKIQIPPEIKGRITIRLHERPIQEILRLIAAVNGFSFKVEGNQITLSSSENFSEPPVEINSYGLKNNPSSPEKLRVLGIAGNDSLRRAWINFFGTLLRIEKDEEVLNCFKVVEILPERVVIYSKREQIRRTFPLRRP